MSRRGEFPSYIIEAAYRKFNGSCDVCGSKENLEVHHISPLFFLAQEFPELSLQVITSLANARLVCAQCHDQIHRKNDFSEFRNHAEYLLTLQTIDMF